jgi:hypothetical protein
MHRIKFFISVFFAGFLCGLSAQNFDPIDVPVYKNNQLLSMSNAGGLRNPHFSNIDINNDGIKDLMVFDRTGNLILPFIKTGPAGQPEFRYAPEYISIFPEMRDWALMADFNLDGIEDIFTASATLPNCCIEVWKGERLGNGSLRYQKVLFDYGPFRDILQIKIEGGNYTNLYTSNIDVPAITDIDNDGDIDIISFDPGGRTAIFNKNMSVEKGLGPDSLDFIRETICWGNFVEAESDDSITLSSDPDLCASGFTHSPVTGVRHSGSTLLVFDNNGDKLPDLLLGDIGSANIKLLHNGGTLNKAHMTRVTDDFPSYDEPVSIRDFTAVFHVDANGDGIRDLIATTVSVGSGQNIDHIWLYINEGQEDQPLFRLVTKNFLVDQMPYFYGYSHPAFIDINNDGLQDIVLGTSGLNVSDIERENRLVLLLNVGSKENPVYEIENENYLNIGQFKELSGRLAPHFGDLDNDGDNDLIIGDASGRLMYFENISEPGNPASFISSPVYPFPSSDFSVLQNAKPFIFDINEDGLPDIIVGKRNTQLHVLINQGTQNEPVFTSDPAQSPNIWNLGEFLPFNSRAMRNGAPFLVTTENKTLLIFGTELNGVLTYDTNDNPEFSTYTQVFSTTENLTQDVSVVPALADIDNDGYLEMIIGQARGGLSFFNTSFRKDTLSSTQNTALSDFSIFPNPSSGYLSTSTSVPVIRMELWDIKGQLVRILANTNTHDLSDIPSGIYIFKIVTKNQTHVKRLILSP